MKKLLILAKYPFSGNSLGLILDKKIVDVLGIKKEDYFHLTIEKIEKKRSKN